jgi:hypothetical protein
MKGTTTLTVADLAAETGKDAGVITAQVDRYLDGGAGELSFKAIAEGTSTRVFAVLSGAAGEVGRYTVGVTPLAGGVPQAVFTPANRYAEAA